VDRHPVPLELLEYFRVRGTYLIVSHVDPDGDCIGSSLALAGVLRREGNNVLLLNPGPFERSEIRQFSEQFLERIPDEIIKSRPPPRVVVLDVSTRDRIGKIGMQIEGLPIATLDHHSSGDPFGDVRYIDATAPATSFLVQRTLEALGYPIGTEEAEHLLFALSTDTGYFRFMDDSAGDVFSAVGRLLQAGASPARTYHRMYGDRSLASRKVLSILLRRTRSYGDGRLLVTWQTARESLRYGEEDRDSMSLYQLLMTTKDCEVIVFLRPIDRKTCSVSLRSLADIDVGKVAQKWGGGGHARAAGFVAAQPLRKTRAELVSLFNRMLSADRSQPI